jgi:diguanylate cyclase (GGDEF)-like protein
MAVVFLDLDGFKQVNDTLGHDAGDVLLKMVAERLVVTVREEDTVARLGGDEFMIVLWSVSGADLAAAVALKVIEAVAQPYGIEGHSVSITTSAGVGIYPDHGEDADTLIKSADLALYEAKRGQEHLSNLGTHRPLCGRAQSAWAVSLAAAVATGSFHISRRYATAAAP